MRASASAAGSSADSNNALAGGRCAGRNPAGRKSRASCHHIYPNRPESFADRGSSHSYRGRNSRTAALLGPGCKRTANIAARLQGLSLRAETPRSKRWIFAASSPFQFLAAKGTRHISGNQHGEAALVSKHEVIVVREGLLLKICITAAVCSENG